ncbi:glycosyltransferase [Myxosarcina sp. GI1(2024)]
MRIAFLVGEVFPNLSKTFIINQITGLIDRGYEVDMYAGIPDLQQKIHPDVVKYQLEDRIYYDRIPKNKFSRLLKTPRVLLTNLWQHPQVILSSLNGIRYGRAATSLMLLHQVIVHLNKHPYDIVHCHFGYEGLKSLPLRDLGLLSGKLIVSFHGVDMTRYLQEQGDRIYDRLFEQGNLFLPISNHWKRKLIELGCPETKIQVHHMGIDGNSFSYVARQAQSDRLRLVSVCRLVEKKGIEYAIRAVARCIANGHAIEYQIVGDGELSDRLQQLCRELKIEDAVSFRGSQTKSDVVAILNGSDVLLAPSVTARDGDCEGIPVSLMEAMATGLPVVSTWHSGIPELVEDGISGFLVAERDVEGLAAKIEYLCQHPEARSQLGITGAKQVREHYNIHKLNDRLVEIYEELYQC